MTNVSATPEKVALRARLFGAGIEALQSAGYAVARVPGSGKSSLRRLTKNGKSIIASIRTTQDCAIAFPRNESDTGWLTLSDAGVDVVVAVSVDDRDNPQFAQVHLLDGDEMRQRYDRAYAARKAAGHVIPIGRGVWLSLYVDEDPTVPSLVGAGAGNKFPAIATIPLQPSETEAPAVSPTPAPKAASTPDEAPLTIAEAKRRLALTLGVDPSSIKITVEA